DVVLEPPVRSDDVIDDPAEERDVGSGTDGDVDVGHRAGPGESRIHVDDRRAAPLRLHHPPEADRMALGEVGPFDQDAVSVLKVLLKGGGSASSERDPQTGDRRAVSYPGLILDL